MLQEEEYEESTVPSATWGVGELKEERIQKCRLLLKNITQYILHQPFMY